MPEGEETVSGELAVPGFLSRTKMHGEARLIKLYKQGRMRSGNHEVCEPKHILEA